MQLIIPPRLVKALGRLSIQWALTLFASITAYPAIAYPVEVVGKTPQHIMVATSCRPPAGNLRELSKETNSLSEKRLSKRALQEFLPFAKNDNLFRPANEGTFGSIHSSPGLDIIYIRVVRQKDGIVCFFGLKLVGNKQTTKKIEPVSKEELSAPVVQRAIARMVENGVRLCQYWNGKNVAEAKIGSYPPFDDAQLNICSLRSESSQNNPRAVKMGISAMRLRLETENYILLSDQNMAIFIDAEEL